MDLSVIQKVLETRNNKVRSRRNFLIDSYSLISFHFRHHEDGKIQMVRSRPEEGGGRVDEAFLTFSQRLNHVTKQEIPRVWKK